MSNELEQTTAKPLDLSPQNFDQALKFAEYMADSDLAPKDFKGKPGNCLIAMQWGSEIGLKPMQALQNIAVINGRPALWGDAVIALVRASPLCEYIEESDDGSTATCRAKRRGEDVQTRTFSVADSERAGLKGKQGPWSQYPQRMRQMRARAFALRDLFPDVLKGLPVAEEVMDTPPEKFMGAAETVKKEITSTATVLEVKAGEAALMGRTVYAAFWKALEPSQRAELRPFVESHQKTILELEAKAVIDNIEKAIND